MQKQPAPTSSLEKEYSDLIDIAVHDLDAPLRKLLLLIEMMMGKLSPDKDIQSYIERIENCVGDMRSLIDDLSILSRISADNMLIISCNIDSVIHRALQEIPESLKLRKTVITTFSLPVIEGDAGQLTRLFKSIFENAIKFSKKDTQPEIHISSSVLSPEEKKQLELTGDRLYHKIVIADNGMGFKNEHAEKIFRPFIRLHGKSQFPGNGIGLAICKKIMDIHHGSIYAEGGENEGARFTLVLPEIH